MCDIANWVVAGGTVFLGLAAVFGKWIYSWFFKPSLRVDIKTEQPYCHMTFLTNPETGEFICDCLYLWLWVENKGNAIARNVEIYAKELREEILDKSCKIVRAFPPMNLQWAHIQKIYFPLISPDMGKHCVLGHISDPSRRPKDEENPSLGLSSDQTSFFFNLIVSPNHKGHIIGPGLYQLDILMAAENHKPIPKTVELKISGKWDSDEDAMLNKGVGVRIL